MHHTNNSVSQWNVVQVLGKAGRNVCFDVELKGPLLEVKLLLCRRNLH